MTSPSKTAAGIGGGGGGSRPHFFKIILDDAVRDGKLFIPTKFVEKYGGDLKGTAVLRDPSGTEWTVELTESEGDLWLQKGFRQFAEFYSLAHGHLVVFELVDRRISCFNVVVFDPTATEIEYPSLEPVPKPSSVPVCEASAATSGSDESETDDDDDDSSVEILDVFPSMLKSRGGGGEGLVRDCLSDEKVGIGRTAAAAGLDGGEQWKKKRKSTSSPPSNVGASVPERLVFEDDKRGVRRNNGDVKKPRTLSLNEKTEAIDRAKAAFTSQNPHFLAAIYPSYLNPGYAMGIPMSFAREHLKGRSGDAILSRESSGGRRWKVKYATGTRKASAAFQCGWKEFAGANQLKVGDVCAFELVKSSSGGGDDAGAVVHTFRVAVFRRDQKVG